MLLRNPFTAFSRFERILWIASMAVIAGSFVLSGGFYLLTLAASLIGVTALILLARGDVWGQLLTVLFSLLYAIISYKFRYFGEMITYLGMTAPIAMLTVISWLKHPFEGTAEVKVHHPSRRQWVIMVFLTLVVTLMFYLILAAFNTSYLPVSTLSIATSFLASYLMLLRSPVYALAYAANDLVLIVLWVLATLNDLSYLPMVACFSMFLINDLYGFVSWIRMKNRQSQQQARVNAERL